MDKSELIKKLNSHALTLSLLHSQVPQTLDKRTIEKFRKIQAQVSELKLKDLAAHIHANYLEYYVRLIHELNRIINWPVELYTGRASGRSYQSKEFWEIEEPGSIRGLNNGLLSTADGLRTLAAWIEKL